LKCRARRHPAFHSSCHAERTRALASERPGKSKHPYPQYLAGNRDSLRLRSGQALAGSKPARNDNSGRYPIIIIGEGSFLPGALVLNQRLPGFRIEPSLLSNQSFAVFRGSLILKALHIAVKNSSRVRFDMRQDDIVREVTAYACQYLDEHPELDEPCGAGALPISANLRQHSFAGPSILIRRKSASPNRNLQLPRGRLPDRNSFRFGRHSGSVNDKDNGASRLRS
jgi:hypothetical protein